jgi:ribonuclease BN (tRNA processing enzyme)
MKLRILGPYGGDMPRRFMTAFVLDEKLLVDAGTIGQVLDLKDQCAIRDVLVSHAHLDHCGALPFFAVNIFGADAPPVRIHAQQATLDAIQAHLLNNQVWPDFTKIKKMNGSAVFELSSLVPKSVSTVGEYQVTPIPVNHPVPCTGFVITKGSASLVYTADTGSTEEIWQAANQAPNLKALITEISYPNQLQKLAEVTGHFTANDYKREVSKVRKAKDIQLFVYHMKPEFDVEIRKEVKAMAMPNVKILKTGQVLEF